MVTWIQTNLLAAGAIACAGLATLIMLWFLVRRPKQLTRGTKLALFLGIGVFPLGTAATGNVSGFEATKQRSFCGSCHVMTPYSDDSNDQASLTLASRHARNDLFGEENCYACHSDYGMFGTVSTKLGGLRHVYEYSLHYHDMSLEEARRTIKIIKPFQNSTCMHCHSTTLKSWLSVGDHASLVEPIRDGGISCASAGCHGPAHPFSKDPAP